MLIRAEVEVPRWDTSRSLRIKVSSCRKQEYEPADANGHNLDHSETYKSGCISQPSILCLLKLRAPCEVNNLANYK